MGDARYRDATVEAVIAVVRESLSRSGQNESGKVYDRVVSISYPRFVYYSTGMAKTRIIDLLKSS
jgi:hypothetical protein